MQVVAKRYFTQILLVYVGSLKLHYELNSTTVSTIRLLMDC